MKKRLDEALVERGFFANLHDAQAAVLAGEVIVGDHRQTSAGLRVADDAQIRLKSHGKKHTTRFVSRGGEKLAAALETFSIDCTGLACADLGASSGGFTDCLLQNGAARVSAIDVNYGQFDWRLRNDERVSLFERTNVRGVGVAAVGGPFDLVVADLSFIRLDSVLDDVKRLLVDGGSFVSLVKPQFEARKDEIDEGGIVRDASVHEAVLTRVASAVESRGMITCGLTVSPLTGADGNIEFLLWSKLSSHTDAEGSTIGNADFSRVVREAHETLGG